MVRRWITTILILTFISLVLLACESAAAPGIPAVGTPQPDYAAAQSTLEASQSQMMELAHQATAVSLNMIQAANAAEQATLDHNQQRMMDLAYQATSISLNMAKAAATQQFITEQTQMASNAAATAQSQAATATHSSHVLNVTQTAQVQAILDRRAAETAHAVAALTAIPLTITPLAETQAAILFEQRKYERQSFWSELVTPLRIILTTLVILLLILGSVVTFRRFMPVLEYRLRNPRENGNVGSPLFLMDGMVVDIDPNHRRITSRDTHRMNIHQPQRDRQAQMEILNPSEPSIKNWITEAEQELRTRYGSMLP